MKKLLAIILVLATISCSENVKKSYFSFVVEGMEKQLPATINTSTKFYSVDYSSIKNTFTYHYIITDEVVAAKMIADNKSFIKEKEPEIIEGINDSNNQFFQKVIEFNTTVVYSYKTNSGTKILDMVMTPEKYNTK